MDINGRHEYLKVIRERYEHTTKRKQQKHKILDELCYVCEYNCKYTIQL
jgi:hypothetical protein